MSRPQGKGILSYNVLMAAGVVVCAAGLGGAVWWQSRDTGAAGGKAALAADAGAGRRSSLDWLMSLPTTRPADAEADKPVAAAAPAVVAPVEEDLKANTGEIVIAA